MSVRYEWGWDVAQLVLDGSAVGSIAVVADDTTDSGTGEIASGTLAHTDMSTVLGSGEYTGLAAALQAELDTVLTTNGSTVSYSAATASYTLTLDTLASFDFRSATLGDSSGKMLAALLGFNYLHPEATGGSASDPYNILLSDSLFVNQTTYTSNCRPYMLINPAIGGRSNMSDEYEEEGGVSEAVADDGTAFHIAKDGLAIYSDWVQMGETNTAPTTHTDDGTPVFKRSATAEVPWTYQHAFEHARTLGSAPFLVADSGTAESAVHQMRADGSSLKASRFASADIDLWNVPFKTRLLGRL